MDKNVDKAIRTAINAIEGTLDGVDMEDIHYNMDGQAVGSIGILFSFDAVELNDALATLKAVI